MLSCGVRPSVRPFVCFCFLSVRIYVTFVYSVKTSKHNYSQTFFIVRYSHHLCTLVAFSNKLYCILVFRYQILLQYSDGDPVMWASNAGRV